LRAGAENGSEIWEISFNGNLFSFFLFFSPPFLPVLVKFTVGLLTSRKRDSLTVWLPGGEQGAAICLIQAWGTIVCFGWITGMVAEGSACCAKVNIEGMSADHHIKSMGPEKITPSHHTFHHHASRSLGLTAQLG